MYKLQSLLRGPDDAEGSQSTGDGDTADAVEKIEDPASDSGLLSGLKKFREKGIDPSDESDDTDDTEEDEKEDPLNDFDLDDIFSGAVEQDNDDETQEDDDEEGSEEDGEEKADDGKQEEDKEEDVDIESLTTEDGKPISKAASTAFKTIKEKNKKLQTQLTEAQDAAKGLKPAEDFDKISKENADLKKQIDLLDFRSSEDFKDQYDAPVQKAIKDATRWISTISEENTTEASRQLTKAQGALQAGNESAFFEAVDNINENHLPGTRGGRFISAMNKLWDANETKIAAEKDMEKAREDISKTRQTRSQSSEKIIEATIGASVESFQQRNKSVLDFYRNPTVSEKFKVDEVLKEAPGKNKKLLQEFLATGRVSEELSSIMLSGNMESVRNSERELLLGSIQNFQTKLKQTQDELAQYQGKLKKVSSKRGTVKSQLTDDDKPSGDDEEEYGLVAGLRKLRNR